MISEKELETSVQSDKINQNHFFQPLQKNTLSMIALQHVVNANYQKMEDIFQTNPFSMFVKAKVIIDDVEIESSPLQYAIDNADSHAWKICQVICQKHPEYEMLFNKHQIQNPINLQPLYDAYDNYLKLFHAFKDQYKEDKYIDPGIQEAFLNVGKMQQACMPKHLLREMCQLPGRSEWYDLVLLSIEPDTALDLKQLKAISEQYQKCPVLVQQGHRMYIYGHSGDTWTWTITQSNHGHSGLLYFHLNI